MKYILLNILLVATSMSLYSQEVFDVAFDGDFGSNFDEQIISPKKEKDTQLKTTIGTTQIRAEISDNLYNLDMLARPILEEAIKIWRENLLTLHETADIVIIFDVMDLPNETAYRTRTSYYTHTNGLKYPITLAEAIFGKKPIIGQETVISFNSNSEYWYFKGDMDNTIQSSQYDFLTAALRALTQAFGFKASVRPTNTGGIYPSSFVNCFDEKIINSDNVYFSQLNPYATQQVNNYLTGDNVYLDSINSDLKLYAPNNFAKGLTLDYFDSEGDLMSYNFSPGTQIHNIDNKTVKVMNAIGWPFKETDFKIIGNTPLSGIISMYNSYSFSGSSITGAISNHYWEYRIKQTNNSNKIIKTSTEPTFTISPLSNLENGYETNSYGDIIGEIYLEGTVNGKTYSTTYNLYIERKPNEIEYSYKVIGIDEFRYKLEVTIQSLGASSFRISVMDWGTSYASQQNFTTDNYLKFLTPTLTYGNQILLTFLSENKYGSFTKNVTIPAIEYNPYTDNSKDRNIVYNILNVNGNLIKRVSTKEAIYTENLKRGFYIIHEVDQNSNMLLCTKKVFIND